MNPIELGLSDHIQYDPWQSDDCIVWLIETGQVPEEKQNENSSGIINKSD